MKKMLKFYYLVLILVLSCQALYTVYKLGGTVGQGERMSHLQQQQAELNKELQVVQENRFHAGALTTLAEQTAEGYQPIQAPIILSAVDSVASR